MTRKASGLPARVYVKHGAYYYVTLQRKWIWLCRVSDGIQALYAALAAHLKADNGRDAMPAVIGRWLELKVDEWAGNTAKNQERLAKQMAEAFADFAPAQVTTPVAAAYLKNFTATPRTYNMHRTMLRQVLAFAALEGLREGFNPVDNVPTKALAGRKRRVTDDEIQALKAAAMQQSRNGEALVQMIDLALLTGQRIGDLIKLRWQDVTDAGLEFEQQKTGERLLVQWSPALRAVIDACARGDRIGHVLTTQSGRGYRYAGVRSAWVRACERAGITDLHIHDLRGRAGMDARERGGLEAAKDLLGHKSIRMTEHYVDGKSVRKVNPSG